MPQAAKTTSCSRRPWRDFAHANNAKSISSPIDLGGGVTVELMFSPNTKGKLGKNPHTPNDMGRVFELMDGAKQAVLFRVDPGNNSILDEAGKLLKERPISSCAATSPVRAKFSEALHAGGVPSRRRRRLVPCGGRHRDGGRRVRQAEEKGAPAGPGHLLRPEAR